ncbi:delta-aminolevulinic acid dehydratase [Salmonella enterica subsp. enterica]|uniref:Delta-aminolevulinic acid dehydratase n=1 Tax=Salmonella enterica I TaxID=59201 RepID=A0A379WDS3_SALET|nr:delta-aminolevulinic acid dehydratase [Salmonella enterica subsp. enterica]
MTDLIHRPRRLRNPPALRAMFEETTLSLNDLVLPIFVEEELDDYKAIDAMPGVMRIPEKQLAREIETYRKCWHSFRYDLRHFSPY